MSQSAVGHLVTAPAPSCLSLVDEYLDQVERLDISDRAKRGRRAAAIQFLAEFPDLDGWMAGPTSQRIMDLKRTEAWPLIVFAIASQRLRLDLELAGTKNLTGLGSAIWAADPAGFERAQNTALSLGWGQAWVDTVLKKCLAVVLAFGQTSLGQLDDRIVDDFESGLQASVIIPASSKRGYRARLASLRTLLFELEISNRPPRRQPWARTVEQRFADVTMPEALRAELLRYVQTRASVLRPKSVESLINSLLPFAEFVQAHYQQVASLHDLERHHIEAFLIWNRHRPWRGQKSRPTPIGDSVAQSTVLALRNMFEDIAAWGWTEAPQRQLVFSADVPKLATPLPRALPPDIDQPLMTAVDELPDLFAAVGLQILRSAGLRVGELLDLECEAVLDYGAAGTWLRVPLGKLNTERAVPLAPTVLASLDKWAAQRGQHRPVPHPRTGRPTHFMFTNRGRRLSATRLRNGLLVAVQNAGLTDPNGQPLRITCHQLRHTYATELVNAGMSLQALMALLGHVTAEMTVRYATLTPTTLNSAYESAVSTLRPKLALPSPSRPIVPDKIAWLSSEMIKTRLANGYCSRHRAAGPCAHANICETCQNFTPAPEFKPTLTSQLTDTQALKADAEQRGWTDEANRHQRVAEALQAHLNLLPDR